MMVGRLYGCEVVAAALRFTGPDGKSNEYRVAYTFKSPKDTFELNVALGNLGIRLQAEHDNYVFKFVVAPPGQVKPRRLLKMLEARIQMDLAVGNKAYPQLMEDRHLKGDTTGNYGAVTTLEQMRVVEDYLRSHFAASDHPRVRKVLVTSKQK